MKLRDRARPEAPDLDPTASHADAAQFLEDLARCVDSDELLTGLARMRDLNVLVVGETILDEYVYCDPMGKSGKEPILVTRLLESELQAGGVLAIANHAASFCNRVSVLSALGERRQHEDWIREHLAPEITTHFLARSGATTIVKRRYLDRYSLAKFFGVYDIQDGPLQEADETWFQQQLTELLPRADVVIVADYGHGLLSPQSVELLTRHARFLAVNTQLNAANSGFHVVSRYPRADYACIHELELRLDARDRQSDLPDLIQALRARLAAEAVMVTLGKRGTLLGTRAGVLACPAFAQRVVERVGAGDAVLTVSSMALAAGLAPELVSLLGNLAGAQAVEVVGNSAAISGRRLVQEALGMLESVAPEQSCYPRGNNEAVEEKWADIS